MCGGDHPDPQPVEGDHRVAELRHHRNPACPFPTCRCHFLRNGEDHRWPLGCSKLQRFQSGKRHLSAAAPPDEFTPGAHRRPSPLMKSDRTRVTYLYLDVVQGPLCWKCSLGICTDPCQSALGPSNPRGP